MECYSGTFWDTGDVVPTTKIDCDNLCYSSQVDGGVVKLGCWDHQKTDRRQFSGDQCLFEFGQRVCLCGSPLCNSSPPGPRQDTPEGTPWHLVVVLVILLAVLGTIGTLVTLVVKYRRKKRKLEDVEANLASSKTPEEPKSESRDYGLCSLNIENFLFDFEQENLRSSRRQRTSSLMVEDPAAVNFQDTEVNISLGYARFLDSLRESNSSLIEKEPFQNLTFRLDLNNNNNNNNNNINNNNINDNNNKYDMARKNPSGSKPWLKHKLLSNIPSSFLPNSPQKNWTSTSAPTNSSFDTHSSYVSPNASDPKKHCVSYNGYGRYDRNHENMSDLVMCDFDKYMGIQVAGGQEAPALHNPGYSSSNDSIHTTSTDTTGSQESLPHQTRHSRGHRPRHHSEDFMLCDVSKGRGVVEAKNYPIMKNMQ